MGNFLISDQQFKRVLDFLGLRGIVQHDYVSTIIPTIQVGTMPDPTEFANSGGSAIVIGQPFFSVPSGETWAPVMFTGTIAQVAGTIAPQIAMQISPMSGGGLLLCPCYSSQQSGGEVLNAVMTLNSSVRITVHFKEGLLMPSGSNLTAFAFAGDGTISLSAAGILVFRRYRDVITTQS